MNTLQIVKSCQDKLLSLQELVPLSQHQSRLSEITVKINEPSLWNDPLTAAQLMKEFQKLSQMIDSLNSFTEQVSFYNELSSFPEEIEKEANNIQHLHTQLSELEFHQMMKDPMDANPAIISISAGAGGLEAANWVSMLLRMYSRYASARGFAIELLDRKDSEEHGDICIDSVSIRVDGPFAFGFLKSENGVHRLIRNSPFNAGDARQTSFAGVSVLPDIEDSIDIHIEEKDLEISTMRASGSGGQAVNKIESAVRIVHLPTGIVVNSRAESSQHTNRRFAMKMLKVKLYEHELKKKQAEKEKQVSSLSEASFGHQIRTYTLTPYSLCKDHRSDYETSNVIKVLDGDVHDFLLASLRKR